MFLKYRRMTEVYCEEVFIEENNVREMLIEQLQAAKPHLDKWMVEAFVDLYLSGKIDENGNIIDEPDESSNEKNE
jgi:hypothetical protein